MASDRVWLFKGNHFQTLSTLLAGSIALVVFASVMLKPLWDPDLWWHLKTGEVILERGALLTEDPFAFTSEGYSNTQFLIAIRPVR